MSEQTIPAEVQALVEHAQSAALTISQFQIVTAEDYKAADLLLRDLKEQERVVKEKWKYLAEPHNEGLARLKEFFKPVLDKIVESKTGCDQTMTSWRETQRRLAEEEQKRQEEIANRERARLEAEAAKERAAAEQKAREKQQKADELVAAGKDGQAAKARAQAESLIEVAEAKAIDLETVAASVPAPRVAPAIPKIAGSFGRSKGWGARERPSTVDHPTAGRKFTSLEVLILAVADAIALGNPWPEVNFLMANQKALDKRADDLKEDFNIPGYESYWKGESTVSRRR